MSSHMANLIGKIINNCLYVNYWCILGLLFVKKANFWFVLLGTISICITSYYTISISPIIFAVRLILFLIHNDKIFIRIKNKKFLKILISLNFDQNILFNIVQNYFSEIFFQTNMNSEQISSTLQVPSYNQDMLEEEAIQQEELEQRKEVCILVVEIFKYYIFAINSLSLASRIA